MRCLLRAAKGVQEMNNKMIKRIAKVIAYVLIAAMLVGPLTYFLF